MVNDKFKAMNDWLAKVQEKCPKKVRSKKQIKDRDGLPRLEELEALLQEGRDMNLVLLEEEERLAQVIIGFTTSSMTSIRLSLLCKPGNPHVHQSSPLCASV